ncbi:response regulator [Bradyrhizobium ontarionense]|uniref:Response regulator n=1 Tax=Bradyrhizobium ontarionense TaxID=2898149 RepID=A0ABY3R971_9BRAD|nr:response regulator [Bradyrhizobium sp. A19]UFZ03582.1 response regulator [Bradyrhizobium sp. A19]
MSDPIHVLLVEDNEADVDLTRATLDQTRFDIQISVAKDGVEAIDFLYGKGNWSEPGRPTLILLDLNLPRKDGRQVLAVLKSEDDLRRIPVVILSSSDADSDITSCYHLGANCYIVKPVDLKEYRSLVRVMEDFWLGAAKLPRREGHSNATRVGGNW